MASLQVDGVASNSYKHLKEEFVSNLHGTTMLEIAALSAIVPGFVILRQWSFLICNSVEKTHSVCKDGTLAKAITIAGWRNSLKSLALDFILVVVPTLSCLTILADWIYICTTFVLCLIAIAFFRVRKVLSSDGLLEKENMVKPSQKMCIASYRFVVMLVTCVSILAVDFTVYPRRYAKTETYGTGLMDVGVGSFVVANAIVSRQARNLPAAKYGGVFRNTSPLLILGFTRLILTKEADYQVHVGEYGVHWNFFFTLAGVAVLTSLIRVPPSYCGIVGLVVLVVYQVILLCGLNNFLTSAQRGPGIISLNKEGVFSLFGYWGLYLVGVHLGHHLFFKSGNFLKRCFRDHLKERDYKAPEPLWSAAEILILGSFFWILAVFLNSFIEKISRRTCNLAYVVFVLATNLEGLGFLSLSENFPKAKKLFVEEIFDQNLLATFLLANVLTGIVNVTMDTIFATAAVAYATLFIYLVILVGGMALVKGSHLKLKFW